MSFFRWRHEAGANARDEEPAAIPDEPLLRVDRLCVAYGDKQAVNDISFDLRAGRTTALIGESGSGKSTISRAIIGLLPAQARIAGGKVLLAGRQVTGLPDRALDHIRGRQIGFVPQDPGSSLDPRLAVGSQIEEIYRLHRQYSPAERRAHAHAALEKVGFTDPERQFKKFPHELSGGMKQRVLIAIAVALRPSLIIADEPTSALDVTVQRQILDLLDAIRAESGSSLLLVTHDLALAHDRADDIIVLREGKIEEKNSTSLLFSAPGTSYTRQLLADSPVFRARTNSGVALDGSMPDSVTVSQVSVRYGSGPNAHLALDNISFSVRAGTTHGIIGESGSGKTTLLRCLMGIVKPDTGDIHVGGQSIVHADRATRRALRQEMQLVYQNPWSSFDPRLTVRQIIEEPLRNQLSLDAAGRRTRVGQLLDQVHLPQAFLERYPLEISGGQCQRVALARALAPQPRILVLDEFVSALDVTIQARILDLLAELRAGLGLTYIFVSHDLAVVRQIADTLSVIRRGHQEEYGMADTIFESPASPYTRSLLDAIPGRAIRHQKRSHS